MPPPSVITGTHQSTAVYLSLSPPALGSRVCKNMKTPIMRVTANGPELWSQVLFGFHSVIDLRTACWGELCCSLYTVEAFGDSEKITSLKPPSCMKS